MRQQCSGSIPKVNKLTHGTQCIVNCLRPSGVRVDGVSCLDNCPGVTWPQDRADGQMDGRSYG